MIVCVREVVYIGLAVVREGTRTGWDGNRVTFNEESLFFSHMHRNTRTLKANASCQFRAFILYRERDHTSRP